MIRPKSPSTANPSLRINGQVLRRSGAALRTCIAVMLAILLAVLWAQTGGAATLSDPEVGQYNVRVGTQTFAGLYQFTTNSLLVETAEVIQGMGSDIIKLYLGSGWPRQYHRNLPANVTNLLTLVRDEPSCRRVFDMPFRHVIAWAYPFGNPDAPFSNGYLPAEGAADYREMYDLTRYLLTNYNNSGKTFYLGHWEGDGYFMPWTTNASPVAIQGMIAWLNNRQKAVDDAKAGTTYSNVNVFGYAEANRVRDAMLNGPTNNQRVINMVVPYVTNLDYLSYSSYDAMDLGTADLYATLDYMHSMLPTNKSQLITGERIWIGEYGWGGPKNSDQQEPTTRAYLQKLLNYPGKGLPYLLFWEVYNNETNRQFWLVDSNNVKVPCYYLHERFINNARLAVGRFKESNGRLPSGPEFSALTSPMLNAPLSAPVALAVTNLEATLLSSSTARLSGSLAQGIYGDDGASLWVFYGRNDGGQSTAAWERSLFVGQNTNFNPQAFQATVTNLVGNTNYFFRFYATNANGAAWPPASESFTTAALDPSQYGSRLHISFTGLGDAPPQYDVPVLLRLSTNLAGFSYGQFASASGGDLRFADAGGLTALRSEIDEWNTNGISLVWVRVPRLSASDSIWAYWGNPLQAAQDVSSTNGSAWAYDHHLVWHLKENTFPYADSSRQHPAVSGIAPLNSAGLIGRAQSFNGSSQYIGSGAIDLGNAFTLSAWVKIDPAAADIQTIWANKAGGWATAGFAFFVNSYLTADGTLALETGNGTTGTTASTGPNAVSAGQWHHVAAAVDKTSGTARLFVDGVDKTLNSSIRSDLASQAPLSLGRFTNGAFYFRGIIDEARIEKTARPGGWILDEWMTSASNALVTAYSSVSQQSPHLSFNQVAGGVLLSWPSPGVGFAIYSATNLAAPALWSYFPATAAFSNGAWQVLLPAPVTGSRFFRLQSAN